MYIDGEIVTDEWEDSDTSAAGFRDALKSLGDVKEINLHINELTEEQKNKNKMIMSLGAAVGVLLSILLI